MCSARVQTQFGIKIVKLDIFQTKRRGKQTRGKLVTAATNDVRVFFFHFFCEKCSKMKNEKMGKKAHQTNTFRNDFQKEATLVMENKKANTWRACYSRHH